MIGPFKRRSSWPSSIATGLIGWIGMAIIVALALGSGPAPRQLVLMAVVAAVAQVVVLRLAFAPLKLDRTDSGMSSGAQWGAVTGVLVVAGEWIFFDEIRAHVLVAVLTGLFVGGLVGAFLSYFYADDRKIEREARIAGSPIDYGRDAHWLDPFVYGAIAYELAVAPRTADLAIGAAVVGMIVGVGAAGVSHFILSRWGNALVTIPAATLAGAVLGVPSGLLFRSYFLGLSVPLVAGAMGGALTFLVTSAAGRRLAALEQDA